MLRAPVAARASPCSPAGGVRTAGWSRRSLVITPHTPGPASLGGGSQAATAAAAAAAAVSLGWSQPAAATVSPKPAPLDPQYFSEEGLGAQAEKPTLTLKPAPLTAEEAVAQAAAERLPLVRSSSNTSGYLGVWVDYSSR